MSKKTLLGEGSVRHFMKLACLQPLAEEFVSDLYKEELAEEEEVVEANVAADGEDIKEEVTDEDVTEEVGSEEEVAMDYEEEGEIEEPAPEMEMGAEELSITPEEAGILVKLGQKIAAAGTDEAPAEEAEMDYEEEVPADDMGGEVVAMASEEEEEAPAMRDMYENLDDLVAEVSKRVKERLAAKQ